MESAENSQKSLGLLGATGVGVGAIVGGGLLAIAGVAFAATGPSAILALSLNGVIALLTALSFAEMASRFPESGGTYNFSRKVLSVEAAFTVGWVVWFASVVAAVLYALGFAHFAIVMTTGICDACGRQAPTWMIDPRAVPCIAVVSTMIVSLMLIRTSTGGGQWVNVAKIGVFGVLLAAGFWALWRQPVSDTQNALRPFFASGTMGLLQAMGYSFICLQGFDLIAAVGGEVRNAKKNVPRAMLLSLAIALAIYIPLFCLIATVGVPVGESVFAEAQQSREELVAIAARNFLGETGYWLIVVAAVLSMFSALQANLFAASRIARAMAEDRSLPAALGQLTANRRTPAMAIVVTGVLVVILVVALPDIAAAGAAASLIFLMTFAISHWLSVLIRLRSTRVPPPFRIPLFPLVPIVGGLSCLALAVFQGFAVPAAGLIAVVWLSFGGLLFLSIFARRARLVDVRNVAADPELLTLRGHAPLVLVPIANPHNAQAMITLADVLVPAKVGRVLIQTVVVAPATWQPDDDPAPIEKMQEVLGELLSAATRVGIRAEAITTVAPQPMEEIARVAELHRCESVLLGMSQIKEQQGRSQLERLLGELDTDVVVLRVPENWQLSQAQNILVPVAGRGGHDRLLTRLLGSLSREQKREVKFLRVMTSSASAKKFARAKRDLARLARDNMQGQCERSVIRCDSPIDAVVQQANRCGLLILGIQRLGRYEKFFGRFTREIVERTDCPIIVLSRRG